MTDPAEEKRLQELQAASAGFPPAIASEVIEHPDGITAKLVMDCHGDKRVFYAAVLRNPSAPQDVREEAIEFQHRNGEPSLDEERRAIKLAAAVEAERLAEAQRRNAGFSRSNAETQEQRQNSAETQKAEREALMKDIERISSMSYADWSSMTNKERAKENEKLNAAESANDAEAKKVQQEIKEGFLKRHGDGPEAAARWAEIEKGAGLSGKELDAFISSHKLTPEEAKTLELLARANAVSAEEHLGIVVITAARIGADDTEEHKTSSLKDAHEKGSDEKERFQEINSVRRENAALNLQASTGAYDVAARQGAYENSNAGLAKFDNLQADASVEQKQEALAVRADNLDARKQVNDVVAKRELEAKKDFEAQDDWGNGDSEPASVASTTAPSRAADDPGNSISPAASRADPAASNDPNDTTNDLTALLRTRQQLAGLDAPETAVSRRPTPAMSGPTG